MIIMMPSAQETSRKLSLVTSKRKLGFSIDDIVGQTKNEKYLKISAHQLSGDEDESFLDPASPSPPPAHQSSKPSLPAQPPTFSTPSSSSSSSSPFLQHASTPSSQTDINYQRLDHHQASSYSAFDPSLMDANENSDLRHEPSASSSMLSCVDYNIASSHPSHSPSISASPQQLQHPHHSTCNTQHGPSIGCSEREAALAAAAALSSQYFALGGRVPLEYQNPYHQWLLSRHSPMALQASFHGSPISGFMFANRKMKRMRTAFNPQQLIELEKAFEKNHYVVGNERKQLAEKLSLSETQVKVWFQNRRTKYKRQKQDGDEFSSPGQANATSKSHDHDNETNQEDSENESDSNCEDEDDEKSESIPSGQRGERDQEEGGQLEQELSFEGGSSENGDPQKANMYSYTINSPMMPIELTSRCSPSSEERSGYQR